MIQLSLWGPADLISENGTEIADGITCPGNFSGQIKVRFRKTETDLPVNGFYCAVCFRLKGIAPVLQKKKQSIAE